MQEECADMSSSNFFVSITAATKKQVFTDYNKHKKIVDTLDSTALKQNYTIFPPTTLYRNAERQWKSD